MSFAAVFPGQGSQSLGMLADLSGSYAEVTNTFQQASDILNKDLWAMVNSDDDTLLNQTENTQPAMLAAGVAVWRVWQSQSGCLPTAMAGHSLGEYSAMVASNILTFEDATLLVKERSHLMQQAVPAGQGAMAAILGLDDVEIINQCAKAAEETGNVVEAVNFNSPGQVVIAGDTKAVDKAIEYLTEAGAKRAIKLAVSVPSHCSLMIDAASKLEKKLLETEFSAGNCAVLHNVSASAYDNPQEMKIALARQLYKPVHWVETIKNLASGIAGEPADTIIEFGPGKILFGLNRRIDRNLGNICIHDTASLEQALQHCS